MFGSPLSSSAFSDSALAGAPVRPRGWLSGAALSNFACGASPKPLRLWLDQRGIEQLGEMLAERMDFGPRGLGLHAAGGFFGGGHGVEYGAS